MTDMKIKSIICIAAVAAICALTSGNIYAQELEAPEGYEYVDSLVYTLKASVDSALVGKDVFRDMPSRNEGDPATVEVEQSELLEISMRQHVQKNGARTLSGYRVRIFFDNKQSARNESEQTLMRFRAMYPDVAVYRTYTNPYFKVTVGDCRTKSEAMKLLSRIKGNFSSAFVVKENIGYPLVDDEAAYTVDTVKVLRPVAGDL
jgi:hypothetical protein